MANDQEQFAVMIEDWSKANREGQLDRANEISNQILEFAGENADWENDPDLRLSMLAHACEESGDWEGARECYESKLAIADMLFAKWFAHRDLSQLHYLLGQQSESLAHAKLALVAARQDDSEVLLAMALQGTAGALMVSGAFEEAGPLIEEALKLTSEDPSWVHLYASACTLQADWYLSKDIWDESRSFLDIARPLLEGYCFPNSAGLISHLSYWHLINARYHEAHHSPREAREAWRRAIQLARQVARLPHAADVYSKATLAKRFIQYAAFLRRHGQQLRAWWYDRRAVRIRKRLKLPDVPPG